VDAKEMVRKIEEQIRFDNFSGCFPCGGVPQEICNRWGMNERGGTKEYREGVVNTREY